MTSHNLRRLAAAAATFSLSFTASAAINSAAIVSSTLSPQCLEYKVVGICYWLLCGPHGCKVKTSVKVRHYVPDAVVSSYANTGSNPWTEVSALGTPNPLAQAGNDATTNYKAENSIGRFKEADVIGHPGGATFSRFASASGYVCPGATFPLVPYFLSTLDAIGWRHGIPEQVYPEALVPGLREVGGIFSGDMWGNLYPRSGFLHQTDDYKTAAVIAQRAGDITTRIGQLRLPPHARSPQGRLLAGGRAERGRCLDREMAGADPVPEPQLRGVSQLRAKDASRRRRLRLGALASLLLLPAQGANLPRKYRLPIRTRRRIMRMNITSVALTWLLAAQLAQADDPINVSKSGTVLSDEVLYSIGGGSAVSMGSAGQMDSIGVGFGWNNDLMCGNMNLSTTLENQLNGATQGFQNIMGSVIQNATGAVMSLPALIIQRANPQLYNLITNGILQARIDYDRSKGTCRAIAEKMADIAGEQTGWGKIAEGQALGATLSSGGKDAVSALEAVEKKGGNDGVTWVGGDKAGGSGQKPIRIVNDVTRAGYNLLTSRSVNDSSSVPSATCNNGLVCNTWSSPRKPPRSPPGFWANNSNRPVKAAKRR